MGQKRCEQGYNGCGCLLADADCQFEGWDNKERWGNKLTSVYHDVSVLAGLGKTRGSKGCQHYEGRQKTTRSRGI